MNLLEGFVNYTRSGRFYSPRVSISGSGWLSINSTLYKDLGLDSYQGAEFFFNPNNRMVGIKFCCELQSGAYKMNPRVNKEGEKALYMSIKGFVQTYKIVAQGKTAKYSIVQQAKENDTLIILLKPISMEVINGEIEDNKL